MTTAAANRLRCFLMAPLDLSGRLFRGGTRIGPTFSRVGLLALPHAPRRADDWVERIFIRRPAPTAARRFAACGWLPPDTGTEGSAPAGCAGVARPAAET